jgi:hypothetical protein
MSAAPSAVAAKRNFRSGSHWLLGAARLCVTATVALIWHNDHQAASAPATCRRRLGKTLWPAVDEELVQSAKAAREQQAASGRYEHQMA